GGSDVADRRDRRGAASARRASRARGLGGARRCWPPGGGSRCSVRSSRAGGRFHRARSILLTTSKEYGYQPKQSASVHQAIVHASEDSAERLLGFGYYAWEICRRPSLSSLRRRDVGNREVDIANTTPDFGQDLGFEQVARHGHTLGFPCLEVVGERDQPAAARRRSDAVVLNPVRDAAAAA